MRKIGSCNCRCKKCTVGFWGTCDQSTWATGIDFPATYTKLLTRDRTNISTCNVLVVGRYSFSSPYLAVPSSGADYTAVASWITGGGVLFVMHEYYGSPSIVPSSVVATLNTFLSGISTQARAVATSGINPNSTDFPVGTYSVTVSDPVLVGVDKLWVSAPGWMSRGSSTLLLEARKPPSFPYAEVLTIEAYGAGFVVFCNDLSIINNSSAATAITSSGNKINVFLQNLCKISTN